MTRDPLRVFRSSSVLRAVEETSDQSERFPMLRQEALYVRIASHVRELIETKQLRPGERLPTERELAQLLGVSRVPIREAMRTLATQGLVDVRRGQGMFVAKDSLDATVAQLTTALLQQRDLLVELFAVRRLLEPASAQWAAARADPARITTLQRIIAQMRAAAAANPPDVETMASLDLRLHVAIAATADNRVLVRIMEALQDLHREQLESSLRYRNRVHETMEDHIRIVDAIAARDPVEARAAMIDHIARSQTAALARIGGDSIAPPRDGDDPSPLGPAV